MAKLLMDYGADVNAEDESSEKMDVGDEIEQTSVVCAIKNRDWETIKLLLTNGANVEGIHDLLITAIRCEQTEIVEVLLQRISDTYSLEHDTVNSTNDSCIPLLHISIEEGNDSITRMLLNKGADVNAKVKDGTTALHNAVFIGRQESVEILLNYGAEVNVRAAGGVTPLHIAAENGHVNLVETLIKSGADIYSVDGHGRTAFHIACKLGCRYVIMALFHYGYDINRRNNKNNLTLVDCACTRQRATNLDILDPTNVEIIVQHIAKLKAHNLFVDEAYLLMIDRDSFSSDYYISCKEEIIRMKSRKICGTISFYDVFFKSDYLLAVCAKNETMMEGFKSKKKMFPIYADIMEYQVKKGHERECLKNSTIIPFSILTGYKLPYVFTSEMFNYLSNTDLKNIISACPCV